MARVAFQNITKNFPGGVTAVDNLSLDIDDGSFVVLVGPSGCGKSTALRLVAGLEPVTAGEIVIGDNVVNEQSPQERNIAMVFQNYALYPHKTVRKNLDFPLKMMNLDKNERAKRIDRAARLLDLHALLDRRPAQLSGGQRQRVAMGRAIVRDPHVFLMDEPLSNLDAKLRVQIRAEIAQLQRELGVTTIYVTHDQAEAMTLGERVAVLKDGRLQQIDEAQALYDRPANLFVATFIGSPSMNVVRATVEDRNAGTVTLDCGGETSVKIDAATAPELEAGAEYYVGVRPEAFFLADSETRGVVKAEIETVEALGHEQIVYFRAPWRVTYVEAVMAEAREEAERRSEDGGLVVARLSTHARLPVGGTVTLGADTGQFHFFDLDGAAL